MKAPVLIIAFNRPDTTKQVFDAVRAAHPSKLFFAVDASRREKGESEILLNQQVKNIVRLVDWPCEVYTRFSEENQGCGFGPANAITWAFENEDRLIVLEDDCVPVPSFFTFCEEMLEKYKNDERVTIVSGRSHQVGSKYFDKQDYVFTHYAHTWGWATWKRVWDGFDMYMQDFPEWLEQGGACNILSSNKEGKWFNTYLKRVYERINIEVTHSWDSQWFYALSKNGGLGIVPCRNLINNVGAGNGTHTPSSYQDIPVEEMPQEIRHPKYVIVNRGYEGLHFNNHINPRISILKRVINKIQSILYRR